MKEIFVNLKRFDVPKSMGGICPNENPKEWIENVIDESIECGIGRIKDINVTYLLPEALIITARERLITYPESEREGINIGCQGVFRENVKAGGNFGAFTTNRPAAAAKNIGCTWTIIGHSEERKDKLSIIERFETLNSENRNKASMAVSSLINDEVLCALDCGINVLLCIGETEDERGGGIFEEQKPRIKEVLKSQLETGLNGIEKYISTCKIVIGYEPVWAIGPGRVPPNGEYIEFVSSYIKSLIQEKYNFNAAVVYGGGLKEENAEMISSISSIDGGLVALTRFTGEIGFKVEDLRRIIDKYLK